MAQRVSITLIDDIDGKEAAETVRFGLDGTAYEIDLSKKNAAALRKALAAYVDAGRKVGRQAGKSAGKAGASKSPNAAEVRAWAVGAGLLAEGSKGRIPASVVDAYESAN